MPESVYFLLYKISAHILQPFSNTPLTTVRLFQFQSFSFSYFLRNILKRKERSSDEPLSSTNPLTNATATAPQEEEYEAGRVICQVCGVGIAFRDESTNEFTMKHWDAHRLAW